MWHIVISPHRQAGSPIIFCSAASFSLRGCRVPSKVFFTAKHLTVFGLFRIALSKKKKKEKNSTEEADANFLFEHKRGLSGFQNQNKKEKKRRKRSSWKKGPRHMITPSDLRTLASARRCPRRSTAIGTCRVARLRISTAASRSSTRRRASRRLGAI